jgi:hypothetical protein
MRDRSLGQSGRLPAASLVGEVTGTQGAACPVDLGP